jgi:hypothetical protein
VRLYLFAEGKTEEGWADWLHRTARGLVVIDCEGEAGVPRTLLEKAKDKRAALRRAGSRTQASRDEVWIVFDRDDHPDVPGTLEEARDAGIGVVFSNECFEVWPLLHFEDRTRHTARADLQRELHALHPHYDHDDGARVDWEALAPYTGVATHRAIGLHQRGETAGNPFRNPSTTAWLLDRRCRLAPAPATLLDDVTPPELRERLRERVAEPLRSHLAAR